MTLNISELNYNTDAATIQALKFPYHRSLDQDASVAARHTVVVIGAGPVGLSLAIDLAQKGQAVLVLDNDNTLSTGSRAICFSKRTLEIWDRLQLGEAACAKGVGWQLGKVYFKDQLLYSFDLQPEPGHERPAFINLQQYYAEAFLAVRAAELPQIEIRWLNTLTAIEQGDDGVRLEINTPDGNYHIHADYVVACDGSRSSTRALMGLESKGRIFQDRFLIADVRMQVDFPAERWFWFDPPFHPNQSVLLHRQPDNVWRIDFQLGWDADPEQEKKLEHIKPRVDAMMHQALGHAVPFELEWASVYTFACRRMDAFRHGRVLFAGDAAHGVSPFGARGANSGVQDAENLAWKLDLVLRKKAPARLLDTYASEREFAADENLLNSTRATDFITPKSEISRIFRDAALDLAADYEFARRIVNSGRLSVPATLSFSSLNTPDAEADAAFSGTMQAGAVASDGPLLNAGKEEWLLRHIGEDFCLLMFGLAPAWVATLSLRCLQIHEQHLHDYQGLLAQRYDARDGTAYLIRPDQHICARWRHPTEQQVRLALQRACGQE